MCVPRGRRLPPRLAARVHWVDHAAVRGLGWVTDEEATLSQCLRWLSFDEALSIADSALRHGGSPLLLEKLGDEARGPGSRQLRRVAAAATALAANPFESALRAACLDVAGLQVRPQVWVNDTARADLVDERLRLVVEADFFAWHGGRSDLARDARRYNRMVCEGWRVLRFAYEHVVGEPDYVRAALAEVVETARSHTERPRQRRTASDRSR